MEKEYDFLVLGSGIAGLSFAIKAAGLGSVAIFTKKEEVESNTNYAQGGIAAVTDDDDNFESHINDTLKSGSGL
ncbi:MAG: FAD-binding protein, partial [Thermodesulfobacteriota bacterium]|nr:FAD-binding protein [Thermodesulfobacteriota bacterium]